MTVLYLNHEREEKAEALCYGAKEHSEMNSSLCLFCKLDQEYSTPQ
jgi:hypothetical protein